MAITASMVKELREISGAGMMDCKKALTKTDGDMDKAIEFLRENGLAKAAKKAGRVAAEGMVATNLSADGKTAAIVEVNSETDFVAKNEKFQTYVSQVAAQVAASSAKDVETFLAEPWIEDSSKTVNENLASMIAVIGENMTIRRFDKIEATDGIVESYIHAGGKIGVLVQAKTDANSAAVKECLKNVAMQVAALNPKYTSDAEVDQSYIEHEKEILKAQAQKEKPDAPEKIIDGMVMGRIKKELKEICLLDQVYVKAEDGKQSVKQYVDSVAKAEGISLEIKKFVRFETGEGIEKVETDFAAEVAAQLK
ncbi:MAG: elongation factor Ts [Lachnospiraceae bacterium]|jgi:elongation factor Ts|nr:elongation factor Ts [Lachnospiraceae bacterium]MBQ5560746.1 elongation factor Ts [Lachnospiraceae bacterium]